MIDSGIDGTHPELEDRIAASRSFVGGNALTDQQGHGTFVAGLIAAQVNNGRGSQGWGFPAQLVVAKVVRPSRTVSLEAEVAAIRWAVDQGARVINLSLGGLRDPRRPDRDTYSTLEAAAIRYAYTKARGRRRGRERRPGAHLTVAIRELSGGSAARRRRERLARRLRARVLEPRPDLQRHRRARTGHRLHVSAAADQRPADVRRAGVLAVRPESTAAPRGRRSRRRKSQPPRRSCSPRGRRSSRTRSRSSRALVGGRERIHGLSPLPAATRFVQRLGTARRREVRRDALGPFPRPTGTRRTTTPARSRPLRARASFTATLDFWDDPTDVYKTYLRRGQRLTVTVAGPRGSDTNLVLWRPGTRHVEGLAPSVQRQRAAQSARRGSRERITYRAFVPGWYYVQVRISSRDAGAYRLALTKR